MKKLSIRTKEQIQEDVTGNFLLLADFVVRKTGPVKSYADFAKSVSLLPQNFSLISQRKRHVPYESAVLACDLYGCSLMFMFGNLGEMFGKDDVKREVLDLKERVFYIEKKLGITKVGVVKKAVKRGTNLTSGR